MADGESSDGDRRGAFASTCRASCETRGLVQREASNMEAGGSHFQATAEEERIVDWTQRAARDPSNGPVLGAPGKEARRTT